MNTLSKLHLSLGGKKIVVEFGIPKGKKDFDDMFELRQQVYSEKKYFHDSFLENKKDFDDYDRPKNCVYFIARAGGKMVGTVRLVQDDPLPTERFFDFAPPRKIRKYKSREKAELSRLVIIKHSSFVYFPRNIILLFFISVLVKYAKQNNIINGYAFLKKGIRMKLKKLKVPIHLIRKYKQRYPDRGMLERYFNERNDKVIPMFFEVDEIGDYIEKLFQNKRMFERKSDGEYILRNNVYNIFLRFLGVI